MLNWNYTNKFYFVQVFFSESVIYFFFFFLKIDTYVGSVEEATSEMWVMDDLTNTMVEKSVTYVPALYKIFDEILVNASDNKQRDDPENKIEMKKLKVTIDAENGKIVVFNDGCGIPIEKNKQTDIYNPELIFGVLLTSDNYNDKEERVTGGRNGFGAKLANIFSTEFTIECCCDFTKFSQTFRNNMKERSKFVIESTDSDNYTKGFFFFFFF
jgi:DNA topoisomerase-2